MPRRPVTAMAFLAGLVAGLALSHGYGLAYVRASQLNVRQVMTLFHRELRAELALLPADHQLVTQATARAAMTRALEENERRESWSVLWRGLTQSE